MLNLALKFGELPSDSPDIKIIVFLAFTNEGEEHCFTVSILAAFDYIISIMRFIKHMIVASFIFMLRVTKQFQNRM